MRIRKPERYSRESRERKATARPGWPPLVFGNGCDTKLLAEIAFAEPVTILNLPERQSYSESAFTYRTYRLLAIGFIRRFRNAEQELRGRPPYFYSLNAHHPLAPELRDLIGAIGLTAGLKISKKPFTKNDDKPDGSPFKHKTLRARRNLADPLLTLFGSSKRTLAIILIAQLEPIDRVTIARLMGIDANYGVEKVLHPIEADGLIECEISGLFNLYRLRKYPWTPALIRLVRAVVNMNPNLQSLAHAGRTLAHTGRYRARPRKSGIMRDA